ncbi:hypothetical protein H0H87_006453 [Tephrocybe sp. NHM501043]|nr:hypothetical protein H0H87_006453 [Tephrocybe sp. NHM501043]
MNCPVLEELRILTPVAVINAEDRGITISDVLPPSSLPLLSIFEGPYTLLSTLGEGRPLKEIMIWGLDEPSARCDPPLLVNVLRQLSLLNNTLEALNVSVSYVTRALLTTISSFRLLKTLEITSSDNPGFTVSPTGGRLEADSTTVTLLYIDLRNTQLPSQLMNLRVLTRLNHGNLDMPTQQEEASRLIEFLATTHPLLQHVEIGYGTYWTGVEGKIPGEF